MPSNVAQVERHEPPSERWTRVHLPDSKVQEASARKPDRWLVGASPGSAIASCLGCGSPSRPRPLPGANRARSYRNHMDLRLYLRVLVRFWPITILGLLLAVGLAFLAYVRVDYSDGKLDLTY